MILLTLETKEAQFLRDCIDAVVRGVGIKSARNAVIVDDKIVAAMQQESKENAKVVTLNIAPDGTTSVGGATG